MAIPARKEGAVRPYGAFELIGPDLLDSGAAGRTARPYRTSGQGVNNYVLKKGVFRTIIAPLAFELTKPNVSHRSGNSNSPSEKALLMSDGRKKCSACNSGSARGPPAFCCCP